MYLIHVYFKLNYPLSPIFLEGRAHHKKKLIESFLFLDRKHVFEKWNNIEKRYNKNNSNSKSLIELDNFDDVTDLLHYI